ncbi:MAG: 5-formyltetrahydrofolate cyclo-ligase [Deltaproteobacteria bacterium]|nr:5-formyltetrahydrofolate cyclo-ligase [Deltaproteobacteria bacterium]
MSERKAQLRRNARKRSREKTGGEEQAEKSRAAQLHFLSAFPPGPGGKAALYMAVAGEVGTEVIRARYLEGGALLYYPKVMEDGTLLFYPDGGSGGWVRGKYGLLEPRVTKGMSGIRNGLDLVVVPGVAFDPMGRRLGKGYGYYDRFLSGLAGSAVTVGLAFSRQVVPEVPVDPWDVPVDAVVTEDGVIRVERDGAGGQIK